MITYPDINPVAIDLGAHTLPILGLIHPQIHWYGLMYLIGFVGAWFYGVQRCKREDIKWTRKQVEDVIFYGALGVILGGRLGYTLFYNFPFFIENPISIFYIWQGGMSFHGGVIGVIAAALYFTMRHRIPKISTGDMICLGLAPGLFLGRIANFINAELWGRATDVPWGVAFPTEAAQFCPAVAGICARHPSQLYEALLEGLVLGTVLVWMAWRRGALKREGLICGTFLAGYGIARFIVEFVRQPDAQFITDGNPLGLAWQIGEYGLTMGQILSLPMLAVGLFLILRARRKA